MPGAVPAPRKNHQSFVSISGVFLAASPFGMRHTHLRSAHALLFRVLGCLSCFSTGFPVSGELIYVDAIDGVYHPGKASPNTFNAILGTGYSSPLTLTHSARVKTRCYNGSQWSAMVEAAAATPDLRLHLAHAGGSLFSFQFELLPGHDYTLQMRTHLVSGDWTVPTPVAHPETQYDHLFPGALEQGFFRLVQNP
jgi:hypothetical protein